ncbi:hypothetical protein Cme02nite_44550 [Catellatospora methionotrophica]|uniref:Uncharacterized protein n=1 Tax=Catellatospora methionotrophica TaxID=121620 RepID=A0A8J3LDC4_9ACTN|nr:hypothetical protein Cme02nite_44550 [Catellatospora methionotrophica]
MRGQRVGDRRGLRLPRLRRLTRGRVRPRLVTGRHRRKVTPRQTLRTGHRSGRNGRVGPRDRPRLDRNGLTRDRVTLDGLRLDRNRLRLDRNRLGWNVLCRNRLGRNVLCRNRLGRDGGTGMRCGHALRGSALRRAGLRTRAHVFLPVRRSCAIGWHTILGAVDFHHPRSQASAHDVHRSVTPVPTVTDAPYPGCCRHRRPAGRTV